MLEKKVLPYSQINTVLYSTAWQAIMILEKSVYNCKGGFISAMFCLHTFFGSDHYSLQFSDFSGAVSVGSESADQAPIKRLKVFQWRGLCQRNCEQDVQVRK